MHGRVANKIALVTGAASGLGAETARRLAGARDGGERMGGAARPGAAGVRRDVGRGPGLRAGGGSGPTW
jgi:NAD(P)-dependent dehydrogenase (short-subunit alcohol dehydrogenase family)